MAVKNKLKETSKRYQNAAEQRRKKRIKSMHMRRRQIKRRTENTDTQREKSNTRLPFVANDSLATLCWPLLLLLLLMT